MRGRKDRTSEVERGNGRVVGVRRNGRKNRKEYAPKHLLGEFSHSGLRLTPDCSRR